MTSTSYDNNFMFPFSGMDWCSTKCENDLDYIEPFANGDVIKFQFILPATSAVSSVFVKDWSGNVLTTGITISYGIYSDSGSVTVNVQIDFSSTYCSTSTAAAKCFYVQLGYSVGGGAIQVARSNKYTCTYCEGTVKVKSRYNDRDCLSNYYDNGKIPQSVGFEGLGDDVDFSNDKRIYASLKKLPSKLNLSSNTNCYLYKSEIIEAYELQGTRLYPPYAARQIENIMLGRTFTIDGEEYQVRGNQIFEPVKEPGMSMFRLKAQLEKCPCEVVFDCA